jgi:integrase
MPRPHRDGTPSAPIRRAKLTSVSVRTLEAEPKQYLVWDTLTRGLVLAVQLSGRRAFKFIYSYRGRLRWYHIGDADALPLATARKSARALRVQVDNGIDPQADKVAQRSAGTFEELAQRYVDEYAKKKNKSWHQADALIRRYSFRRLGKLSAATIARADIEGVIAAIDKPMLANAVLASLSAIFSWAQRKQIGGIVVHPCKGVERNSTTSRERILSESELPHFWAAFDAAGIEGTALKLILLTGQRPGEVCSMRREHIKDGWWEMPGKPEPTLGWPGTKNGANHRVWIPKTAQALIGRGAGFVFEGAKGRALDPKRLSDAMRDICTELAITDKVTPHDLRRTHGTTITALGFGRDAMNRIQNHKEGGIASVYDRHGYADENKRIMEATAARILAFAERTGTPKVVALR